MPQIALDKKSNFEYLEKEVGLHKFLPKNVINTTKPKLLRKLIQQHFKKYAVLQDLECMFKFFEILKSVYRFDQERYRCALGVRITFKSCSRILFTDISFSSVGLVHSSGAGYWGAAGHQLHDRQRRAGDNQTYFCVLYFPFIFLSPYSPPTWRTSVTSRVSRPWWVTQARRARPCSSSESRVAPSC